MSSRRMQAARAEAERRYNELMRRDLSFAEPRERAIDAIAKELWASRDFKIPSKADTQRETPLSDDQLAETIALIEAGKEWA